MVPRATAETQGRGPAREGLDIPSLLWLARVLDAHEDKDERESAFSALRQEIADFDARVEKERARASVKVEAAKTLSDAMKGNGNASKEKNSDRNSISVCDDQPKKPKRDAAYWIARLKRDAETDTHAAALLGSIESGDLKPYRAAIEMGWVKPPDPAETLPREWLHNPAERDGPVPCAGFAGFAGFRQRAN